MWIELLMTVMGAILIIRIRNSNISLTYISPDVYRKVSLTLCSTRSTTSTVTRYVRTPYYWTYCT